MTQTKQKILNAQNILKNKEKYKNIDKSYYQFN